MKEATSIRLPTKLLEKIDQIIEKGYYDSRSEFVTASLRNGLVFYANLRILAVEAENTPLSLFVKMLLPRPINDKISGFELLMDMKPKELVTDSGSVRPSEESIRIYYKAFTRVLLKAFSCFTGEKKQVVFKFSNNLKDRARILYRMDYGFYRKMDFVKASIVLLLMKIFETDYLYNEFDNHLTGFKDAYNDILLNMLMALFSGEKMPDILTGIVSSLFNAEESEDDDSEESNNPER